MTTSTAGSVDHVLGSSDGTLEILRVRVDATAFQPQSLFVPAICPLFDCLDSLHSMFQTVPRNVLRCPVSSFPPFQKGDVLVSCQSDGGFVIEESLDGISRATEAVQAGSGTVLAVHVLRHRSPSITWNDPCDIETGPPFRTVRFRIDDVPTTLGAELVTEPLEEQSRDNLIRAWTQVKFPIKKVPGQFAHFQNVQAKAREIGLWHGDILLSRNGPKWELGSLDDLVPKLRGTAPFYLYVMRIDAPRMEQGNPPMVAAAGAQPVMQGSTTSHPHTLEPEGCRIIRFHIPENHPQSLGAKVKRLYVPDWLREHIRSGVIAYPNDSYCVFCSIFQDEFADSLGIEEGDVILVQEGRTFRLGYREDLVRMMTSGKAFTLCVLRQNETSASDAPSGDERTAAGDTQNMSIDDPTSDSKPGPYAKRTLKTKSPSAKRQRREEDVSGRDDTKTGVATSGNLDGTGLPPRAAVMGLGNLAEPPSVVTRDISVNETDAEKAQSERSSVVGLPSVSPPRPNKVTTKESGEDDDKRFPFEDNAALQEMDLPIQNTPSRESSVLPQGGKTEILGDDPQPGQETQAEIPMGNQSAQACRWITFLLVACLVLTAFGARMLLGQAQFSLLTGTRLNPQPRKEEPIYQPRAEGEADRAIGMSVLLSHADELADMISHYPVGQVEATGGYEKVLELLQASVQLCQDDISQDKAKCEKKRMRLHVLKRLSDVSSRQELLSNPDE